MKKILLFSILILVLIAVPLFAIACEEEVTPPAEEEEQQPPAEEEEEEEANWWDEFGEPQYGGTITFRCASSTPTWDTTTFVGSEYLLYLESLWMWDWALDRNTYGFLSSFAPQEYYAGLLAESWEQPDPLTTIVHIHQGVHWQDKPPVNGREFTAYDVEEHYNRMMGTGKYTEPQPMWAGRVANWESITATDQYTVVLKLKSPSVPSFMNFLGGNPINRIEAPESVEAEGGALTDWTKAVGTGPWMLTDYADGTSMTFVKNPDYWGYDERHPENQLPYADELKVLIIPEMATAMAAMRTGQIDVLGGESNRSLTYEQAESMWDSNPELVWTTMPMAADFLFLRVDKQPFTDIRVRKALQMAIDRPTLAEQFYHGGVDGKPAGIVHPSITGYCYAYDDWTQELKDEYGYNPTRARELLAEAAADGVFEPNDLGGFDTNIISADVFPTDILEVIQSYFLDIGVDMEISVMDFGTFHAMAAAGQTDQIARWKTSNFVVTKAEYLTGDPMNFGQMSDPVQDQLILTAENAATLAELMEAAVAMDRHFLEQHYGITTFPVVVYNFWQPYFKGYSGEECHFTIDPIFARCWIDQALKESLGR